MVSRDRVLQRPKSFYDQALKFLTSPETWLWVCRYRKM